MKIGVVLSGGGAKGAYQVGFLKALEFLGIKIDAISGTSIGALNAAFYLSSNTALMEKIWRDEINVLGTNRDLINRLLDITTHKLKTGEKLKVTVPKYLKTLNEDSIFDSKNVESFIKTYVDSKKLIDSIPFYIGVTKSYGNFMDTFRFIVSNFKELNIDRYLKINSINEDKIYKVLLASASIPLVYGGVNVGGKRLTDGGISDAGNVPIKPLLEQCDKIIVCKLNNQELPIKSDKIIEVKPSPEIFSSFFPKDILSFNDEKKIDLWIKRGYTDTLETMILNKFS